MITGALVGFKKSKDGKTEAVLIEAGNNIASQLDKFKKLNLELDKGRCDFDTVYLFKNAIKQAYNKAEQIAARKKAEEAAKKAAAIAAKKAAEETAKKANEAAKKAAEDAKKAEEALSLFKDK
ncbi:MAG: hypothetical protein FWB90_02860 [Fibromonadales bacterium]|nr:hypothetical protein [Fibromonadales bacterium]